jgi:hypothetical protein
MNNKCDMCEKEDAAIFHDYGEFCLGCWINRKHPDV